MSKRGLCDECGETFDAAILRKNAKAIHELVAALKHASTTIKRLTGRIRRRAALGAK